MTLQGRPQVIYVGPFRLPDLNAAAQRVIANAKGLRHLGYDVVLAETGRADGQGGPVERLPDHQGFTCYRLPMKEVGRLDYPQTAVRQVSQLLDALETPVAVIAYNYPAIALARVRRLCRARGLRCAADVTEWYGTGHLSSPLAKAAKWMDTTLRMRVLHRRLDALVVISTYLEDFYRRAGGPHVVRIPPLVDASDEKWRPAPSGPQTAALSLVYAGSASAQKERLDLTVSAVVEAARTIAVHLDVVGATAAEFQELYPDIPLPSPDLVTFHGRVSHREALAWVSAADYSVIARDNSRVTDAGFPTKFVESISLGTPAFVTPHPDLSVLLEDGRNGSVLELDDLASGFLAQAGADRCVDRRLFDISRYDDAFCEFARALGAGA